LPFANRNYSISNACAIINPFVKEVALLTQFGIQRGPWSGNLARPWVAAAGPATGRVS
jgi:hypothetical protein